MESNIKCCDKLKDVISFFDWYSYKTQQEETILCLPTIKGSDVRINNCPSCGKEIRSIEILKSSIQ